MFGLIWSYGSALYFDGQTDNKLEFSKFFQQTFPAFKFPPGMSVFDAWIDPISNEFVSWNDKVPKFELDTDIPLQACLVHNSETVRITYFLDILVKQRFPAMLVGLAGCGKTLLVNEKLGIMGDDFAIANVPFNFYYTSEMTQKVLEKPLEKKAGKNYGPPGSHKLVYFLDDMNMPEVETYGAQPPIELLRQLVDCGGYYDLKEKSWVDIVDTQVCCAMGPPGGGRHALVLARG